MNEYAHIRAAFREVALGLMEWTEPPAMTRREYRRAEGLDTGRIVYRPYDPQGEVEAYDVQADWDERS